jgi:pimeloyl-ACP methyl ester carboxylesterase
VIEPVDLGICRGYEYQGDPARTALVLPGRMLAGMPVNAFAVEAVWTRGWRAVLVWDEYLDDTEEPTQWVGARLEAAAAYAGDGGERLVIGKSLGTLAAGLVAERSWRAIWLTPLLDHPQLVEQLRARTAPFLLIGGTNDPAWDGALARELTDDVLELEGADHGLTRIEDLPAIVDAIAAFLH